MDIQALIEKYKCLKLRKDYLVIREVSDDNKNESLIRSGLTENRAYGYVIAKSDTITDLNIGDLVAYNEYEGQELIKYGLVKDDLLIVLKEENVFLTIKE